MSWNLSALNLKNINITEEIENAYLIEVPSREHLKEIRGLLKKDLIVVKIVGYAHILVFLGYNSQIEKVKNLLKNYDVKIIYEKLVVRYEIKLPSKRHLKKLSKMLYRGNLLYKVTGKFFIEVFCGHYSQINKFFEILEKFDRLYYIIKAE
jgi:hypothetical protein